MLTGDGNWKNQTNKLAKKETNTYKDNISYQPKNNFTGEHSFLYNYLPGR